MLGSIGLWRPATRRSRAEWPVSLASFLLLLCATTLLAATTLYADTVGRGGVLRAILDAPPASRAIQVRASTDPEAAAVTDATVRAVIEDTLAPASVAIARVDRIVTSEPGSRDDGDDVRDLVAVGSFEGIADRATLIEGRWPSPDASPIETAIPAGAAELLELTVGDRLTLNAVADDGAPIELLVVGRWEPGSRDDPYWLAEPLELDGVLATTTERTAGPLVLAASDVIRIAGDRLSVQWRAVPDPTTIPTGDLAATGAALASLDSVLRAALPDGPELAVRSELPATLRTVERSVLVSRSGIALLTIQFAVLAGYAVLLVAGMLAESRRAEVALLGARGAGTSHLALIAIVEGLLLAVPAALLAPFLALGIVGLIGIVGPLADVGVVGEVRLGADVFVVSALAAAGYLVALVLPAITAGMSVAGVRAAIGRQVGRTLPQRLGIDLALVVVAVIALWQLRLYGAPITADARGALGIDPLLVAAPAIGLLAGAVLATRLIPRLGEVGERLTTRRRALVGPLGTRQVARRPLRYTRSALLLMLAAALGTFAVTQAATWTRSQADQAGYQAAADARLLTPAYDRTPPWLVGDGLRGVEGVVATTPVVRQVLDVGRAVRDGELLGLDAAATAALLPPAPGRDPTLPELLERLTAARPTLPTIAIEGDPIAIAVELTPDLDRPYDPGPDAPSIAGWPGIGVTAVLIDGDGRTQRIELERGTLGGGRQRLEGSLRSTFAGREVGPTSPLELVALEFRLTAPNFEVVAGTIDIDGVATTTDGATWHDLPLEAGTDHWAWTWSQADRIDIAYLPPDRRSTTIVVGVRPTPPAFQAGEGQLRLRFRAKPAEPEALVPAIAGTSFLDATGVAVGDRLAVESLGQVVTLEIVGAVEAFAPLDPEVPFVVVDAPTLERWRFETMSGATVSPQEWWLAIQDGQGPALVEALAATPLGIAEVVERTIRTRQLAGDPILLGVIGALGLGALAALAFAAIGTVVSATISASERIGEFALLRALGLSGGGLARWLTLENAFLLLVGLSAGTVLGLVLAWVVLPVSTLTATGATPVPAPEVVVPWEAVVPLAILAGALLAVTVILAVRQLPGVRVSGVLRAWEG